MNLSRNMPKTFNARPQRPKDANGTERGAATRSGPELVVGAALFRGRLSYGTAAAHSAALRFLFLR